MAILPLDGRPGCLNNHPPGEITIDEVTMTMIDVLLFDGCEALDALGPYEVLAYGGLDVRMVARGGSRLVRTSQSLELMGGRPRPDAEWLVVPGGAWERRHDNPDAEASSGAVGRFAREHFGRGGRLATVCTGAMWLADHSDLLDGRAATTHHEYWDALAEMGADVRRGERVVDDGDLVTAGGVTSGLFLGLHLVERLAGVDVRRRVEAEIELPEIPVTR
jgi:transcriptional regulator GlxA family with amidase domain